MGITAENVAAKWNINRQENDKFAAESQKKTKKAIEQDRFKDEIVPVMIKKKSTTVLVDLDENPRPDVTEESLAKLKPAFKENGVITAGNSSAINDGAAALILISEKKAKELNISPEAEWIGGALAGVEPSIMGIGPIESTRKLLKKLNMSIEEMDIIELNEAFAAQSIVVKRELNIPDSKLNVNGGAIALGHPVGASGCRIVVTLINTMRQNNAKLGLAALCIGGGMGCSVIIKRV